MKKYEVPSTSIKNDTEEGGKTAIQKEEEYADLFNKENKLTPLNRLLSYSYYYNEVWGKEICVIYIHAPYGRTVKNKRSLYLEGFKLLAEIVKNNPNVKEIRAFSALVKKHQTLFKRIGFEIENFPYWGPKTRATISREEFLRRYLSS